MARVAIEDSYWTDPRRSKLARLIGNDVLADGVMIQAWRLAQEHWKRGRVLVPLELFDALPHSVEIRAAGFAEDRDGRVYVRGSAEHHAWLLERLANASAGGKKSATRKRDKKGQLQSKQTPSKNQVAPKIVQPSYSYSPSFSSSEEENKEENNSSFGTEIVKAQSESAPEKKRRNPWSDATRRKMAAFFIAYANGFKTRYGSTPEGIRGDPKLLGKLGAWVETLSEDRIHALVETYFRVEAKWIVERTHGPWEFFRILNQLGVALDSGQDPSSIKFGEVFK